MACASGGRSCDAGPLKLRTCTAPDQSVARETPLSRGRFPYGTSPAGDAGFPALLRRDAGATLHESHFSPQMGLQSPPSMLTPAHPAGRIGPNVLIHAAHALAHRIGHDTANRVLQTSTHHTFETLPSELVDEATANALVRHLVDTYGLPFTRGVMRDAGERTGEDLLLHRIPWLARVTLPALPSPVALRLLLAGIGRHTWTFAGSARVEICLGSPSVIALAHCAMCAGIRSREPICDFYVGTFQRVMQGLLGPHGFAEEITCEACGDSACRFAVGTRIPRLSE